MEKQEDLTWWYFKNFAALVVIFLAFYLFLTRSWAGEDAFIFFKYVDNFVNGHGLVFNIGERVEGFTSPLWIFVLAFLRVLTKLELRTISIYLGLVLSTVAVAILLRNETSKQRIFFPIITTLLVTTSAFRDFSTSGFETALTYLLLILNLILLQRETYKRRPLEAGALLSLLVLNRPESFLILIYVLALVVTCAREKKSWKPLLYFLIPVGLLLGGYQAFRMGYYASLLPNTFYAKKGGEFYMTQGFNYVKDFVFSYPFTIIFYTLIAACGLIFLKKTSISKHSLIVFLLLTGYVLYAGGDYMHGRSLLMAFIALSFYVAEIAKELLSRVKGDAVAVQLIAILILLLVGFASVKQKPYTIRVGKQVNGIQDERRHFGYNFSPKDFIEYSKQKITGEFGWAERGLYYKELAQKLDTNISVVNRNIGYFGYAAGDRVNVMGGILIDPYLARKPIEKRGKIGHEDGTEWGYILSRRPTFSYTPFKYWNENAHFKWKDAPHTYIIKDDSNDSFIPILDLSNKDFVEKFSKLVGQDIKGEIDMAQRKFLTDVLSGKAASYDFDINEYLGFLKVYWVPYISTEDNKLFYLAANSVRWEEGKSSYEKFEGSTKPAEDSV